MRYFGWLAGLVAAIGLIGFSAMAQDPLEKRPGQGTLETRVQNLEQVVIEQQGRIRDLSRDMKTLYDQFPVGIQSGPQTKGKFDSPVKVLIVSLDNDLLTLDNGLALEVAKESIGDVSFSFKGENVELYYVGVGPFPYKAVIKYGSNYRTVKVRLLGRP